jgi:hypothetical protein
LTHAHASPSFEDTVTDKSPLEERNKAIVVRFNKRVIEAQDEAVFRAIFDPDFINRGATPGMSDGADGMWHTFTEVLHPAFPDLVVDIED